MHTARLVFGLLLLSLATNSLRAQPTNTPPNYTDAIAELQVFITRELQQNIPAISIALVDNQTVVWASGYGFADAAKKMPATAETVYRVGSVSKLFTDLAVMQLVEAGQTRPRRAGREVPARLRPKNPFGQADHAAACSCRTGPACSANRRSATTSTPASRRSKRPSPASTGRSWSTRRGTQIKYSNAGIAVGRLRARGDAEAAVRPPYVQRAVLDPLGHEAQRFRADQRV